MALEQADAAAEQGEIPVGAVLVDENGTVVSAVHNLCEANRSPLMHAEMLALDTGCRKKGDWRLTGHTLYVTLEPCPMCAGAISHARVDRVVFGAPDARAGALGSLFDLSAYPLESVPEVQGGVLREECAERLRRFFRTKRSLTH